MRLLNWLEKKLGRYAVPRTTIYLIAGQTIFFLLIMTGQVRPDQIWLSAGSILHGEWWRLFTFLFYPPSSHPLWVLFAWYLFYLMGSALEEFWGAFRYNLFILTGFVLAVAVSFVVPGMPVSNIFVYGSVFLAFAFLFPDFQLLIFFILPVKIKWLALLTWLGYCWMLIFGGWTGRLLVLASVGNFLIFFARDIYVNIRYGGRKLAKKASSITRKEASYFHRCTVCGITDKTHPDMDFRYCPQCDGQYCYCRDHIFSHEHVKAK